MGEDPHGGRRRREIGHLVRTWAKAVHAGDLAAVLDNRDGNIVMFDVPSPEDGVRGLDASSYASRAMK
jgi:ketosteroid isomerase-like protein